MSGSLWHSLGLALDRQLAGLEALAKVLGEEQRRGLDFDREFMQGNQRDKEQALAMLAASRHDTERLMAELSGRCGLPAGSTLSALLAASQGASGELAALGERQRQILARGEAVRRLNNANRLMVARALAMTRRALAFFGAAGDDADTYGAGGRVRDDRGVAPSRLVNKEI